LKKGFSLRNIGEGSAEELAEVNAQIL